MAKPFSELIERMPEESQREIAEGTKKLLLELELAEIRRALDLTQVELAKRLNIQQAAISKVEHQSDIFISTLRAILKAMGAELKLIAAFPEGDVQINQFDEVRKSCG